MLLLVALAASADAGGPCRADDAIALAVRNAVGAEARVVVATTTCELPGEAVADTAIAEPGARLGRPARFRLLAGGRQIGFAVSVVRARMTHVRMVRPVRAGAAVSADDIREEAGEIDGGVIRRMPTGADVVGRRALRPLMPGDVVTASAVRLPDAVRSGDRVIIRAVIAGGEVRAVGIAQQSGNVGDVIRLVNADTRRALRGRIVARSEVEVFHGS